MSFIESKTGFKSDGVNFRTSYSSDVTQHAYVRQQIMSMPNVRAAWGAVTDKTMASRMAYP